MSSQLAKMRRSAKYTACGLVLAASCFLMIRLVSLDAWRPHFYRAPLHGREDGQAGEQRVVESLVSTVQTPSSKTSVKTRTRQESKVMVSTQGHTGRTGEVTASGKRSLGPALRNQSAERIKVGEFPEWWTKAWQRSAVFGLSEQFVGDKPLFEACTGSRKSGSILYDFVEPPKKYLPAEICKNPCWYNDPKAQKGLRCVPYVYMAGVAKCGTSDINKRLKRHPEVFQGTQKEYHWWERYRFGMYDEDNPEETMEQTGGQSFKEYVDRITGKDLATLQKELREEGTSSRIFSDFSPSYMWDPHNWYALQGNQGCEEPRVIAGHHIRHVWPPAKILMIFRHPTPRLYSRFLSRIHRTPDLSSATVKDFHRNVDQSIQLYMKCFRTSSIRQCAYDVSIYREAKVRLMEGMYPVFMEDWLRIWPRHQIMILRYEDYGGQEQETIQDIMTFLGLGNLTKEGLDELMKLDIVNSGSEEYEKYGNMLPQTKRLLDDFYQPFVDQFAQIVNEERFLWKDVSQ